LQRFERYATLQSWKKDDWALNLSTLLSGKALDVYSTLPTSEAQKYDLLKVSLLRRYNLTEDGYRTKFRSAKPQLDETASQYVARISNYLDKWIDLAKVHHNYKGVYEFLIMDQIMQSIPKDMALFIKERKPAGLDGFTIIASQYLEAHGKWFPHVQDRSRELGRGRGKGQVSNTPSIQSNQGRGSSSSQNTGKMPFTCYFCHKPGHSWRQCKSAPTSFVPNMAMLVDAMRNGIGEECSANDSQFKDADDNQFESQASRDETENNCQHCECCSLKESDKLEPSTVAFMKTLDDHHFDTAVKEGHFELKCGHRIPLVSAACKSTGDKLHVYDGYVDNTKVKLLRDSGCEGVVVKEDLVPQGAFTGQCKLCILIDGTIRKFPIAFIEVDTPYLTGKVLAKVMKNPVYDLIIGQGVKARSAPDPDPNWKPRLSHNDSDGCIQDKSHEKGAAIVTGSQAQADTRSFKPLKVGQPMPDIVTVETLREEQAKDATLKKIREMEQVNQTKTRDTGSAFKFVKRNDILFREFQAPNVDHGNTLHQVVVPLKCRKKVMHLARESILEVVHQGRKKTTDKVMPNFFWPGLQVVVKRFCQSGDICQCTVHKGRLTKVPLGSTPLIDNPFDRGKGGKYNVDADYLSRAVRLNEG
jgi:hypothetical protein